MMDALDGIFMTKAYGWAFTSPLRKIYYNLTTTSISIFVALVIGTIQIINVLATKTNIDNYQPFTAIASVVIMRTLPWLSRNSDDATARSPERAVPTLPVVSDLAWALMTTGRCKRLINIVLSNGLAKLRRPLYGR